MSAIKKLIYTGFMKGKAKLRGALLVICALLVAFTVMVPPKPARAQICPVCILCITIPHIFIRMHVRTLHENSRDHIIDSFERHRREFVVGYFFRANILKAMMAMTDQLTNSAMTQMAMIGSFLDAKHQMETQRLFQQKTAEAHKDYQTSSDLCVIGTAARSLGTNSFRSDFTAIVMAQRSLDRQLLNTKSSGTDGPALDIRDRVALLKSTFCDPNDANGNLEGLCTAGAPAETINKDVNYTQTIDTPLTLEIALDDPATSGPGNYDEPVVFGLANNLYGHSIFQKIPGAVWGQAANQDEILDLRSVIAKRSVAEHSFHSIVGLKASGSEDAATAGSYMAAALSRLEGIDDVQALSLIGKRPSYYAMMELMSKAVYLDPKFYINLYDTPANVLRKGAAIKATNLIQKMDGLKSQLRSEAALAVLVEMELEEHEEDVQNQIYRLRPEEE